MAPGPGPALQGPRRARDLVLERLGAAMRPPERLRGATAPEPGRREGQPSHPNPAPGAGWLRASSGIPGRRCTVRRCRSLPRRRRGSEGVRLEAGPRLPSVEAVAENQPHGAAHIHGQRLKAGAVHAQGGASSAGIGSSTSLGRVVAAEDHRRSVEHQRDIARACASCSMTRAWVRPKAASHRAGAKPSGHRRRIGGEELSAAGARMATLPWQGGPPSDRWSRRRGFTKARVPQDVIVHARSSNPRDTWIPRAARSARDRRRTRRGSQAGSTTTAPGAIEEHGGQRRILLGAGYPTPESNWTGPTKGTRAREATGSRPPPMVSEGQMTAGSGGRPHRPEGRGCGRPFSSHRTQRDQGRSGQTRGAEGSEQGVRRAALRADGTE